jgi:hypothetical protein
MKGQAVLRITGGARVGWVNSSWPFARLTASARELTVSRLLLRRLTFSALEVGALEPFVGSIPVLTRGVRIRHTNPNYPQKIIFWCACNPGELVRRIHEAGFVPRG